MNSQTLNGIKFVAEDFAELPDQQRAADIANEKLQKWIIHAPVVCNEGKEGFKFSWQLGINKKATWIARLVNIQPYSMLKIDAAPRKE